MKNLRFVFGAFCLILVCSVSSAGTVAPPSSEAEIRELMKLTWDQEILPEGASAKTLERLLAKGQVVIMNDDPPGGIPWVTAAGVMVDAPPDLVFAAATDFRRYPEFIPMTGRTSVRPVGGIENLYEVTFRVEVLFSLITVEYSVYHYHRPPRRTDWAHASGEFDINSGFWEFIPADDGRRTMVFYSVYSLPRQARLQALYRDEPSLELMTNVATATMVVRAAKAQAEKRSPRVRPLVEARTVEEILLEDPKTLALLSEKGKLMVLEDGPTVYITSVAVVEAPVETAFQVISDFEKYVEFLPGVRKSEIRRQGAKGPVVYQEVSIKLWELKLESKIERELELDPPHAINWTIERKTGGPVRGYWRFLPLENNTKSLIFNGSTEDLRDMGALTRTALRIEPTLEYGLMAAMTTATLDAFKTRINPSE